jgi:hypothetical protein
VESSLLEQVRTACKTVSDRAIHVQIDYDRLPSYAACLPLDQATFPGLDSSYHYLGHGDHTLAFFLILDAINFGSGYFPRLRKRPRMSGYFTVAASLNDYYKQRGPSLRKN